MKYTLLIAGIALVMSGCDNIEFEGIGPIDIGNDYWNDITVLGDYIFVTNYDGVEGPGDRIFLYKLDSTGTVQDSFDLGMNGQGYISIANDQTNLYLVGQTFGNRFRASVFGDLEAWSNSEPELNGWEQGGIAYDSVHDSLYALLWKSDDPDHVRMYAIERETMRLQDYREIDFSGGYDYFAMTFVPDPVLPTFYILCRHQEEGDAILLLRYNPNTGFVGVIGLFNEDLRGIAYRDGQLIASTPDRRIVILNPIGSDVPR